ncbi:hypothetical protein [Variovorax atrisoli]|uniref:hypothetical protein n=1 Tax=Variovorax atrisoli TaxID=3394203 RepID=UPI00035D6A06|nr:hypothetical protein [Variovorax paradoxus]
MEGLKTLVLDYWYKLVIWISVAVLVLALTVPLQVPNRVVLLISLGSLLFGIGQWINHPLQERIGVGFKISGHPRNACFSGVLTEIAGVCLVGVGIWKLLA